MDPLKAEYLRRLGIVRFVPRGLQGAAPTHPASAPEKGAAPTHPASAPEKDAAMATRPGPDTPHAASSPMATRPGPDTPHAASSPGMPLPPPGDLATLAGRVAACMACDLHRGRTHTVFGSGPAGARWMVIGEGPGAEEDRQGLPFVGRAGQLLTAMLEALGVAREAVYIANTVKCRPPQNRDPTAAEMAACRPFLEQQIAAINPALILAVGRIAAQSLLDTQEPLARLRGRLHRYPGSALPLVVTYHPAYLLRSPREKRKAWEDLLYARSQVPP